MTTAKDFGKTQARDNMRKTHMYPYQLHDTNMVPCGLEPQTSRLLAERSSQLSYETRCSYQICDSKYGHMRARTADI